MKYQTPLGFYSVFAYSIERNFILKNEKKVLSIVINYVIMLEYKSNEALAQLGERAGW